jgi:hypothetical protein
VFWCDFGWRVNVIGIFFHPPLLAPGEPKRRLDFRSWMCSNSHFWSRDTLYEFQTTLTGLVLDDLDDGLVVQTPNMLEEHLDICTIQKFLFADVDSILVAIVCLEAIDIITCGATLVVVQLVILVQRASEAS